MNARYRDIAPFFGPMIAKGRFREHFLISDIVALKKNAPHLVSALLSIAPETKTSPMGGSIHWELTHSQSPSFRYCIKSSQDSDLNWLTNEFTRIANELDERGMAGELYRLFGYFFIQPVYSAKGWHRMNNTIYQRMLRAVSAGDWESARSIWKNHCLSIAQPSLQSGRKRKSGRYYRSIATKQEKTWNIAHSLEFGEPIVRGRRRSVPDAWWDLPRSIEQGWKSSKKIRKQWMKNL